MRWARPYWVSIRCKNAFKAVLSLVLPANASYASGKPSGMTIKAMTTCTQSERWAALGDNDRAFALLEKQCARFQFVNHVGLEPLKADPRFRALLRCAQETKLLDLRPNRCRAAAAQFRK